MTFNLPGNPSPKAEVNEIADYAEWLSWVNGSVSSRHIVAFLGREDDNVESTGIISVDDQNSDILDEVMIEIERRGFACGRGYPFRLVHDGTVLRYDDSINGERSILYRYLLLSTRLKMDKNRVHAGIDGSGLLEEIAAHVLMRYIGGNRAHALVFGTASSGGFKGKVNSLCISLGEGGGFSSLDPAPVNAKDGKLDVVAWVPFSDLLPGKLIIFAQCKTGTNWSDHVTQLQPDNFIKKWMRDVVSVIPVRAFCVSEAVNTDRWKNTCQDSGLLFDRCRLIDFCEDMAEELITKVKKWTNAAKDNVDS